MTTVDLPIDEIIQRDPLLRWLYIRLHWSGMRIIVVMSLAAGVLFFVPGVIASAQHQPADPLKGIASDLPLFALWLLIFSPIFWGFYLAQARMLSQIFRQLEGKGVFGRKSGNVKLAYADKFEHVYRDATHRLIYLIALACVAGFWVFALYSQSDLNQTSRRYWFEIKWDTPFYLLGWSLATFVMYVGVLRQVVFIADLSVLFLGVDIQVNPLDSDEVGGLMAVSQLISGTLVFVIGFGLLIGIYILVGYLRGVNIFERLDMLYGFALYVVLAPFCFLVPTLSVRSAMLRARAKVLAPIADEFRKIIEQSKVADVDFKEQNARLKELQERYDTIMSAYPVVPLPKSLLRIFSLAASVPYLSGIVPIAIQWLDPRYRGN